MNRDVDRIRQNKFAQLDLHTLEREFFQQLSRDVFRQRLDQFVTSLVHDVPHTSGDSGVINRASDIIFQFPETRARPGRNRDGYALRLASLLIGHTDVRESFELLDVNAVRHVFSMTVLRWRSDDLFV
jgi:hypothetical protein